LFGYFNLTKINYFGDFFMKKAILIASLLAATSTFAQGDIEAGKAKAVACAACHGADGNSIVPTFPNLAGQGTKYIAKQLKAFKENTTRKDATMLGMVAALNADDMTNIGAFFESQKLKVAKATKVNTNGQDIYRGGITSVKVPACLACHGPSGAGNPAAAYPQLSGQKMAYTVKQLKDFRSLARSNDDASMMRDIAKRMTDAEINDVAQYISTLH